MSEKASTKEKYFTDYPILVLGDAPGKYAQLREVELIAYDGDKYVICQVTGNNGSARAMLKSGYIFARATGLLLLRDLWQSELDAIKVDYSTFLDLLIEGQEP
jgi:hypothetical protein